MDAKNESLLRDGHVSEEATAIFVEAFVQDKTPQVPVEVLNHVESCKDCKEKILDVTSFLRFPDSASGKKKNGRKSNSSKKQYVYRGRIAAAVAAFAVLLSAYFFLGNNPDLLKSTDDTISQHDMVDPESLQGPGNTTTKQSATRLSQRTKNLVPAEKERKNGTTVTPRERRNLQARAAFRINPNLENMIGSPVRGTTFESVTPPNNSVARPNGDSNEPIRFSWKKPLPIPHTLKIVSNTNQELYSYKVKGNSFVFTEKLQNGLYYWKIENSNELLYVGKFTVGKK